MIHNYSKESNFAYHQIVLISVDIVTADIERNHASICINSFMILGINILGVEGSGSNFN